MGGGATSWLSHTSIFPARKQRQHVEGYQKIYYKTGVMEIPITPRHTHMRSALFLYCEDNDGGGITLCMTHSYFMICSQNYAPRAREKEYYIFDACRRRRRRLRCRGAALEREKERKSFSPPSHLKGILARKLKRNYANRPSRTRCCYGDAQHWRYSSKFRQKNTPSERSCTYSCAKKPF